MNIYLDIDGVILGTYSPIEDCIEFLEYILDYFPDSTYWLTTHCKDGENHTRESLGGVYPDELVNRIYDTFQETDWDVLKTDAIDFSKDFIWFDDMLFEAEEALLIEKRVERCHYQIDPHNPRGIKDATEFLKTFGH
jgi:hypothetical protein